MRSRFESAEILAALWRLGAGETPIPTWAGILDRALRDCHADLPEGLREGLSFGATSVGLRCYELPDILLAAQEVLLTSEASPYLAARVDLTESGAREVALSHGIPVDQARAIGTRLARCVAALSAAQSAA